MPVTGMRADALPERAISALVLDAYEISRTGLKVLLEAEPWIGRCLLAADHDAARELLAIHRPDVAVVDVSGLVPFALPVLAALQAEHPGVRLVLTARHHVQPYDALRGLEGARFHPHDAPRGELIRAVRAAVLDEVHEPVVSGIAAAGHRRRALMEAGLASPIALTSREREILSLMSTGATNKEIGAQLYLAPDSVKKHAASIFRKLGARNRTEAALRLVATAPAVTAA